MRSNEVKVWNRHTIINYPQISNISRTKSQNVTISRLVSSLPNPLKQIIKLIMNM